MRIRRWGLCHILNEANFSRPTVSYLKTSPFFVFIFLPLFNLSYLLGLGFLNLFLDLSKLWILSSCLFVFMSCCVCRKFPNKTNIKAAQSFKYFRVGRILLLHFSNTTLFNVQWICKNFKCICLIFCKHHLIQCSTCGKFWPCFQLWNRILRFNFIIIINSIIIINISSITIIFTMVNDDPPPTQ